MGIKEKAGSLLARYLTKNVSAEEKEKVDRWYASYDQRPDDLTQEKKASLGPEIYQSIRRHIDAGQLPVKRHIRPLRWLSAAAALIIIASAAFFFVMKQQPNEVSPMMHIVRTTDTEQRRVALPDGTEIWLQPSAELRYEETPGNKDRTVELVKGEAFFNVFHDASRPFRVRMPDGMYTQVLGTSFTITARPHDPSFRVAVRTGKVAVGKGDRILGMLERGQQLSYLKSSGSSTISAADPVSKPIRFEHATLEELVRQLEWAYFVHIDLPADMQIRQLQCTGTFGPEQSVREVLETLCILHHLELTYTSDYQTFKINSMN